MTGNHGKRKNEQAGDHSEFNYPFVTNRIFIRTYEKNSQQVMSECQPVIAICNKWISIIGIGYSDVDPAYPLTQLCIGFQPTGKHSKLGFDWHCCQPAKEKSNHKKQ